MDTLELTLHGLHFFAPAWFLALGLTALSRLSRRLDWGRFTGAWSVQVVLLGGSGSAVLLCGLWFFGVDGKMTTYGALVAVLASVQWVLGRSWRR